MCVCMPACDAVFELNKFVTTHTCGTRLIDEQNVVKSLVHSIAQAHDGECDCGVTVWLLAGSPLSVKSPEFSLFVFKARICSLT